MTGSTGLSPPSLMESPLPRTLLPAALVLSNACGGGSGLVGSHGEVPATGGSEGMGGAPPTVPPADEVSRFRRLTHREWEQTTRDLLRLGETPGLSTTFRLDPKQS